MSNNIGTQKNKQRSLRTICLCIGAAIASFTLAVIEPSLAKGSLPLSKTSLGIIVVISTIMLFGTLWYEYIKRDEFEKAILEKAITFTTFIALLGFPWYLLGLAEIIPPLNMRIFLFILCMIFLGYFLNYAINAYKSEISYDR